MKKKCKPMWNFENSHPFWPKIVSQVFSISPNKFFYIYKKKKKCFFKVLPTFYPFSTTNNFERKLFFAFKATKFRLVTIVLLLWRFFSVCVCVCVFGCLCVCVLFVCPRVISCFLVWMQMPVWQRLKDGNVQIMFENLRYVTFVRK